MRITIGAAAHVDAGKTTLCEQMLAHAGVVRRTGRVDHGDTFMDSDAIERARGITIFCGQASFALPGRNGETLDVTLMDTPGHVDFAGEMERALSVMDAALLVVSCAEGVQSHTVTLYRMMAQRGIPVMIFLNKTDREGADIAAAMAQMHRLLSPDCILLAEPGQTLREGLAREAVREEIAARDETLLEMHFDGTAGEEDVLCAAGRAFASRQLVPVMAGSALNDTGVAELMEAIGLLARTDYETREDASFSALTYRVRRTGGTRMTYVKVLSGVLTARMQVQTADGEQKVNAVMGIQGEKLSVMPEVRAGQTAALSGLTAKPGERIGMNAGRIGQQLTPLMSAAVVPAPPLTPQTLLAHLRELEEEDPLLSVRAAGDDLSVGIMGAVQIEVLQSVLEARYGDKVTLQKPQVLYKETVKAETVGIGHYEPLRHYAECHLRIEPGAPGSGVVYEAACPPNTLEANWQNLIGKHVLEREHPGVLTGSPLTDVKVTLEAGRAHLKHTEGGDFREACYRAIRNALMYAENVLLEPMVRYELAMEAGQLARITGELLGMGAQMDAPVYDGDEVTLCGRCTAEAFWDYPTRFAAATRGRGRLRFEFDGYAPCRDPQKAVERIGYEPLADEGNPAGSVFCSHGAGFFVAWDHVREWAHCPQLYRRDA